MPPASRSSASASDDDSLEPWAPEIAELSALPPDQRHARLRETRVPSRLYGRILEATEAWAAAELGPWQEDSSAPFSSDSVAKNSPVPSAALAELLDYQHLELLGTGGQGQVYTARHRGTGEIVALKVRRWIESDTTAHQRQAREDRFKAGAFLLQTLDHQHIAKVFDHKIVRSEHGDFCAIVQELIVGARSFTEAARKAHTPQARLVQFRSLVSAIAYAQSRRVNHGDLKPSNVLVSSDGRVVVIDFDAAQFDGETLLHSTGAGGRDFTAAYTSPEQFSGGQADSRSDIYSLGVLLHELITNRCPALENGLAGLGDAIQRDDPPRIAQPLSALERKMETIALQCMRKRPDERYLNVASLLTDVDAALAGSPIMARPPALWDRASQCIQRNRAKLAAAAAVAALVLAGWFLSSKQKLAAEKSVLTVELDLQQCVTTALNLDSDLKGIIATAPGASEELKELRQRADQLSAFQEPLARAAAELAARGRPMPSGRRQRWRSMREDADRIAEMVLFEEDRRTRMAKGEQLDMKHFQAGLDHRAMLLATRDSEEPLVFDSEADANRFYLVKLTQTASTSLDARWTESWRRKKLGSSRTEVSVEEDHMLWDLVRSELAQDERFSGFQLPNQRGLKPIGRDPVSGLQEFAHLASGDAVATRNGVAQVTPSEPDGLTMVLVPGARVTLGSQEEDPSAPRYQKPADGIEGEYTVRLDPFFVSKFELTQAQATWMLGYNPSYWTDELLSDQDAPPGLYPAERISYAENWRVLLSFGLSFPTAAQAEYAMRAGTTTTWSFGSDKSLVTKYMNSNDLSAKSAGGDIWGGHDPTIDDGVNSTAPVGRFLPNPWGLYDVHGNVLELTKSTYFGDGLRTFRDGDGWIRVPGEPKLVHMGGSFKLHYSSARSSKKILIDEAMRHETIGVRPVMPVLKATDQLLDDRSE